MITSEAVAYDANDRGTIQLYGLLYHSYRNAIGAKMFTAAYRPDTKGWYTWALWGMTAIMFASVLVPYFVSDSWGAWSFLITLALVVCVYFPLANYSIRRGLSQEYKLVGVHGVGTQQPSRLVRDLLHFLWFSEIVVAKISPTTEEVKRCIRFIELNSKPSLNTGFFRHPLVLIVIGIVVYAFNARVVGWIPRFSSEWQFFAGLLFSVLLTLYLAWIFYSMRYAGAEDDWRFKRCLNWYLLEVERCSEVHSVTSKPDSPS